MLRNVANHLQDAVTNLLKNEESIRFLYKKYNEEGVEIGIQPFKMRDESDGTQRLFALAGPVFKCCTGNVVLIDELNASLHPKLQELIIDLVHNPTTNKKNGQLIFTTHGTEILTNQLFRRDQVWFTERNELGETELYSLADIKGVRKDLSYGKNYLLGRFGAVPKITPLDMTDAPEINQAEA